MATEQDEKFQTKARRFGRRAFVIILLLALVGVGGYYFVRTYTVSEGSRTGTLFKISKKGIVFKTYEGQLQLAGTSMMSQQSIWEFSVKDEPTYIKIQNFEGKLVRLHYRQLVNPFPWQGDTEYIVYDAEPVSN